MCAFSLAKLLGDSNGRSGIEFGTLGAEDAEALLNEQHPLANRSATYFASQETNSFQKPRHSTTNYYYHKKRSKSTRVSL